jgi:hypothetical protein
MFIRNAHSHYLICKLHCPIHFYKEAIEKFCPVVSPHLATKCCHGDAQQIKTCQRKRALTRCLEALASVLVTESSFVSSRKGFSAASCALGEFWNASSALPSQQRGRFLITA